MKVKAKRLCHLTHITSLSLQEDGMFPQYYNFGFSPIFWPSTEYSPCVHQCKDLSDYHRIWHPLLSQSSGSFLTPHCQMGYTFDIVEKPFFKKKKIKTTTNNVSSHHRQPVLARHQSVSLCHFCLQLFHKRSQDAVIMVLLITPPSPPFLSNHFLCFGRPWH